MYIKILWKVIFVKYEKPGDQPIESLGVGGAVGMGARVGSF